jgi:hypothetical protein
MSLLVILRELYNILTARVSPRDTSKYSAFTGESLFRTDSELKVNFIKNNPKNWDKYMECEGYHPGKLAITKSGYCVHSGLNAARNIGVKFYQRYSIKKLVLVRE